MKLYTEEQVRRIAKLYRHELYLLEAAINTEKPIELPSDEEIEEQRYSDICSLNCKCDYIITAEQGHRIIKCLKCGDVKPI